MLEFLSEFTERTESSRSSIGVRSSCREALRVAACDCRRPAASGADACEPKLDEVLEVRLRERGGVAHRLFGRDRAVRLDRQRQAIVVGALADAGLGDREVRAANRVVDRVDADEVDRQAAIDGVLVGLDVAAALVHVQLDVDVAVVLQREEVVRRIDDRGRRHRTSMSAAVTGPGRRAS